MNISSFITKIYNSFKIGNKKNQPTLEEFINRGFAPKNDKIDILFINPPSTISERYGKDDMGEVGGDLIPLGMASLAAYIREKGFGVGVLDCPTLRINNEDVYKIILDKDPAIIGFSTTTYSLSRATELAKKIREKLPNKLTIIGGSHANVAGIETANEYSEFDIIAYGLDGEYIAHDIVKKFKEINYDRNAFIKDTEILKNIKGIIYKRDGSVIRNAARENIKDLDELPLPARDLFPMERYIPLPNQYKKLPLATNFLANKSDFSPLWTATSSKFKYSIILSLDYHL